MRRRDFITTAACAVAARPRAGVAQQSPKQPRIAVVIPTGNADEIVREDGLAVWPGFLLELRRLGYVEGANLVVERYSGADQPTPTRFVDELLSDVVNRTPTVIVTSPNPYARRFAEKTKTIPIVAVMADPVELGLVPSLARPGGNLTGVSVNAGREIWGKRLQIIKDVIPSASRVSYLAARTLPNDLPMQSLQMAGERLGLSVTPISLTHSTETSYREFFAATGAGSLDALVVGGGASVTPYRGLIAELAAAHRVPAIFPYRDDAIRGGLMAYGADLVALGRQLAGQVVKILQGAKPGDIPIEQVSRLLFVINLKTAGAMGFTFPPVVIAQADEVIE